MSILRVFSTATVVMASGQKLSTTFIMPAWAIFCGVFIPEIADGDISIKVSDDGTNFYPILDITDGDTLLVCKSGSDAGWIDISDYIRFVNSTMKLMFVTTVNANADENFTIQFAG